MKTDIDRERLAIGSFKVAFGFIEFASGAAFMILSSAGLQRLADAILGGELVEDPNDFLAVFVQQRLMTVLDNKTLIAAALLAIGATKIIGGIGFLRGRPWGYVLVVAELTALLPVDIQHAVLHPSVSSLCIFLLNFLLLVLLLLSWKKLLNAKAVQST